MFDTATLPAFLQTIRAYEVGGAVRDELLGIPTKDIDFAVVAPSFSDMRDWLVAQGFEIFVETPEFLTIRARFPRDHPHFGRMTADFVLCRRDDRSSNSRHPDRVIPGTLADDLARRDFTVNAMAKDPDTGEIIDLHHGREDLADMTLRFVGDPAERLADDLLRALRAVRFVVTKGFTMAPETQSAIIHPSVAAGLVEAVKIERVREELRGAFKANTVSTTRLLDRLGLYEPLFSSGRLWLEPTERAKPKGSG